MAFVQINPRIITWARKREGLSPGDVAHTLRVKPEKVEQWERGESFPTFRQAQKLARVLRIPFGYLFLSEIPQEEITIPDLRTLPGKQERAFSSDFRDVLYDALRKRDWCREFRIQEGYPPLDFVGKYRAETADFRLVAREIRKTLQLEDIPRRSTWRDYLQNLVRRAEQAGILVLRNSMVGNNRYRKLSVEEFRGFCLIDTYAPVIFINSNDTVAGQTFTLAHELAHVWIGQSAVSDAALDPEYVPRSDVERFCNRVAGEVLVPSEVFKEHWRETEGVTKNVQNMTRLFKVSSLVILRRAFDLGFIEMSEFKSLYSREMTAAMEKLNRGGGGDTYLNIFIRNSLSFVRDLIYALLTGRVMHREAAELLNVRVHTVDRIISEYRAGKFHALLSG